MGHKERDGNIILLCPLHVNNSGGLNCKMKDFKSGIRKKKPLVEVYHAWRGLNLSRSRSSEQAQKTSVRNDIGIVQLPFRQRSRLLDPVRCIPSLFFLHLYDIHICPRRWYFHFVSFPICLWLFSIFNLAGKENSRKKRLK